MEFSQVSTFLCCGNQTMPRLKQQRTVEGFGQSGSTCAILRNNQLNAISYDVVSSEVQIIDLGLSKLHKMKVRFFFLLSLEQKF